jgi:hypothetical protein
MASTDTTSRTVKPTAWELPAPGYPVAEEAVDHWFQQRYQRPPTEQEVGAIMGEMAQREATPPHRGPDAVAEGWVTGPAAPPTRR